MVKESGTTKAFTFVLLAEAGKISLDLAKKKGEESFHHSLISIVSAAFAFEGFLNHLLQGIFQKDEWKEIKRLGWKGKFFLICRTYKMKPNLGIRPHQKVIEAFRIRNLAAHTETEEISFDRETSDVERGFIEPEKATLESMCTSENAEMIFSDVKQTIEDIGEKADINPAVLWAKSRSIYTREYEPEY